MLEVLILAGEYIISWFDTFLADFQKKKSSTQFKGQFIPTHGKGGGGEGALKVVTQLLKGGDVDAAR